MRRAEGDCARDFLLSSFAISEKVRLILQVRAVVASLPQGTKFDPMAHAPLLWAAARRQSGALQRVAQDRSRNRQTIPDSGAGIVTDRTQLVGNV